VLGRSGSVVLEWTGVTLDLRNNCGDSGPRRGAAGCERENRSERPSFAARGASCNVGPQRPQPNNPTRAKEDIMETRRSLRATKGANRSRIN
jgi:hypothetical protein